MSAPTVVGVLLPAGLAFIMFSLGVGLEPADFRRVLARPWAIGAGFVAQVVLLPLLAWAIAIGMRLAPEPAIGLMILAACPGGVTAGIVTRLARGDTALSITLTALTSVIAFVTVPLIVGGSLAHFAGTATEVALPVGQMVGGLFMITVLPVALGMALRGRRLGARAQAGVHRVATAVFALIVIATFASQWSTIVRHFAQLGPATLMLNLATMALGFALGSAARLDHAGRIAIAVECGMQNSALGIALAVTMLGQPALASASVIYALVMNASAIALICARRSRPQPAR